MLRGGPGLNNLYFGVGARCSSFARAIVASLALINSELRFRGFALMFFLCDDAAIA